MSWPLQWAAMIGDVAAINTLVAAGHDPNVKMTDWFDSEPLGWAASFGQCKAIEALCAAGADPSRPANLAGNTPLSDAQREGHTTAIRLIQEYLSGARAMGAPCAVAAPAVAVVVGESVGPGTAATVSGKVAEGKAPLCQIVEVLKRELQLSGNMKEVVEQAAEMIGLDSKGTRLHDLAMQCAHELGAVELRS